MSHKEKIGRDGFDKVLVESYREKDDLNCCV